MTMTLIQKTRPAKVEETKREIALPVLEEIRQRHNGLLRAEDVVSEAEDERSPIHDYFNWDDSEAAHQYRLWQARQLITIIVMKLPDSRKSVQMYVSLHGDRNMPGGAYRGIIEVMSEPTLRYQLIQEALNDLRYWERKYSKLQELAGIYEAIQTTRKKLRKKK